MCLFRVKKKEHYILPLFQLTKPENIKNKYVQIK